ncbi:MAG: hypothetical protein V3S80_06975 [Sulfurimonadaceae bacterium]
MRRSTLFTTQKKVSVSGALHNTSGFDPKKAKQLAFPLRVSSIIEV